MASTAYPAQRSSTRPVGSVTSRAIAIMAIPAAEIVILQGKLEITAANDAFRRACLNDSGSRAMLLADLADRIEPFLATDRKSIEFSLQLGDSIDARYFQATLTRSSEDGAETCVLMLVDQTAQRHTERSLRREMTTDSLTGLPNRQGFGDLIEAVMATGQRHAVLVVDIHRFGRLNACMGSLVGDELLITVARRLKGALRSRDSIGRTGGNEFGILMMIDGGEDEAHLLAERIDRALREPFRLTDYEVNVEASVGIAFSEGPNGEAEEMIRHAQFAVKLAKTAGHAEVYHPQAFIIARTQFAMETALRRAIEQDELHLAYQPICDLSSGKTVAFEALARWRDLSGVDHSPVDFIPVAEESGLIVPLGRWAVNKALKRLAEWDRAAGGDCGVRLSVNVSAIQLQRDDIPAMIAQALAGTGMTGDRLTLELTESAIAGDAERVTAIMQAMKTLGTTIAMDDFGTGYSSLAYLQKLPIDVLKIDRSFVSGMLADRDKIAIVRAILGLAQALGMKTTAEGIETVELGQTLAALGCTYGQGFYYSRPLEPDAAWAKIAAQA
ncbi:bifunctional diguanylate cyclase/phosphodiesterase [uncultured Sphingomonas sp.]|uniref:putative bifunctional diguanylate cyclase/phosphodiesterase n=1 Tax=uncultured Sphingomonas sp. TaxID=158754 RepID=UPI0025DF0E77|nr:bifunctional diguanylate cyclase/phosphodiesterase [uncultured Sphingomonas sp.]